MRRAAREWGGPLPSIDLADALLVERHELFDGELEAVAVPLDQPRSRESVGKVWA
jgi:hypothetical protein